MVQLEEELEPQKHEEDGDTTYLDKAAGPRAPSLEVQCNTANLGVTTARFGEGDENLLVLSALTMQLVSKEEIRKE